MNVVISIILSGYIYMSLHSTSVHLGGMGSYKAIRSARKPIFIGSRWVGKVIAINRDQPS